MANANVKLLYLVFGIILSNSILAISITEIMFDPQGSDTNREWIEIYGCENISKYKLYEANISHSLTLINGSFALCGYAVISQDPDSFLEDYPNFNGTLIDSTFSLSNNNETIAIKNSSDFLDTITYYSSQGASGNGMSLCKINYFKECSSTPGSENQEITIPQTDFSAIKITEFLPDPQGYDNAPMPEGEFIELYNSGNSSLDLKGLKIQDNGTYYLIITDTNIIGSTIIQPNNYLTVFLNSKYQGFLNNDGIERVKLFNGDNLLDEIMYESSQEGLSYSKINNTWIQTLPTASKENSYNKNRFNSSLKMEEIYLGNDGSAKFGDSIRIKLNLYRGNSTKTTVYLYAESKEKISKKLHINLHKKFTNYTLTVPLQLFPNCKDKYQEGDYNLILEGLDLEAKASFKVLGNNDELCQKETIKTKEVISKEQSQKEDVDEPETESNINPLTSNTIAYESSNIKEKRYALYFLSFILILLIIKLLIKWQ